MKTQRWTVTLVLAAGAWRAAGQTAVDLSRQGKLGTGTTLPAQCAVGQVFFKTDAAAGTGLYACTVAGGWSVVGLPILGGDAGGTQQTMTVKGIQGRGVSAAGPTDQNVLRWNATTGQWEPGVVPSTGTAGPPATCTAGSLYLRSDTTNNIRQLYVCSNTNTWTMASTGSGLAANRPVNCVAGQTWLAVDAGAMTYCSATGNPGTWSTTLAGPQGPAGPSGPQGPVGTSGNTIWSGAGAPSAATGINGDFYLNTAVSCLYGPKLAGAWPGSCTSLIGPAGATGPVGANGPNGANGNTVLSGAGSPSAATGVNGDFYLNTAVSCLYGPKVAGAWPGSCTSLIGPAGATGPAGANGPTGANGNTILNGSGAPASGTGANGDFYLRTDTNCLYGPKASGAWPGACISVVGPPGPGTTPAWTTVSFSSAPAFTVTSPMQVFQITLTGNVTSPTITGTSADGQDVTFKICQDGVGGRTFAPPASFVGFGAMDTTPGVCNIQSFRYDASDNFIAITKMRTDSGVPQLSENNGLYSLPASPQAIVGTNDVRLGNARTPTTHAATHQNGGADEVATAMPGPNAIPKAGSGGTLAAGWLPPIGSGTTIPAPNISGHPTIEGVTSTGASGTGALVFAVSPALLTPNIGAATATTVNKITLTPPATAATLAFGSDNSTWTFPAGGGTLGLGTVTAVSGTANQLTSTGGATPALSLSPTLALPGTVNKITLTAPTTAWTIQPAADNQTTIIPGGTLSTATVTGSSVLKGSGGNAVAAAAADVVTLFSSCSGTQYLGADGACHTASGGGLADPGSSGIVKRSALNTTTAAGAADVIGLFNSCSGTQYLGADGSCHSANGSGTMTVVGAGNLTSTAIMTGGGAQSAQTPSAAATVDSSGNITATSFSSPGTGVAGLLQLGQGTAPSPGTTAITLYAPISVTSYRVALPGAAATGLPHWSNSSGTVTESISPIVAADTDTSIAHTGVDINTSHQVTATHLASALPVNQGGSGQTSYTDGQLLIGNTATGGLSKATLTAGANITITNGNGSISIASTGGGSASPLTTKGDLYGFDAANNRIPIGTNGQVLTADSTQALGLKWASAGTSTAGAPYTQSFTAQTSVALTHNLALSPATAYVLECFSSSGVKVQPASETATDLNTVMVTFGSPQAGSCTIATGGSGGGSGTVTSVSGTANQLTSTGGATPALSLSPTLALPGTVNKITLTPPATAATLAFDSDNSTWTFPAGGGTLGLGTVTAVSGTANQLTSTGGATPSLSLSPTLALPGTVNKITLTAPTTAWTIQPAADNQTTIIPGGTLSTATITGSSVLKGSVGNAVAAAAADVVTLFSSCSGTQYLGADGACHTASGGTVTSVATTGPISGGTFTTSGTISCPTCITSSSPGAGVAHFAGSTQALTSSLITSGDITSGISEFAVTETASSTWTIPGATHGLGTCDLAILLWDSATGTRNRIQPGGVTCDSTTYNVTISFGAAQAGRAVLVKGF